MCEDDVDTWMFEVYVAKMLLVAVTAFGLGYLKGLTDGIERGVALRPAHKRTDSLLEQRPAETTHDLLARMPGTPLPFTDESDDESDSESDGELVHI